MEETHPPAHLELRATPLYEHARLQTMKITVGPMDVNTSGKAGAQIPHLPLGDDSSPRGR
jgi:hypothetical protein